MGFNSGFKGLTLTLYSLVVTKLPTNSTFKYSTFWPQNVLTCFVWISEQIKVIHLYNTSRLGFVIETVSVYSAVRAEYLNIVNVTLSL